MSRDRAAKKQNPDFGKRGRAESVQPADRKPTSMERLKKIGSRWWGRKSPVKKVVAGAGKGRGG